MEILLLVISNKWINWISIYVYEAKWRILFWWNVYSSL